MLGLVLIPSSLTISHVFGPLGLSRDQKLESGLNQTLKEWGFRILPELFGFESHTLSMSLMVTYWGQEHVHGFGVYT